MGGVSHGGIFLEMWILNSDFWCIVKFRLTSIIAENV